MACNGCKRNKKEFKRLIMSDKTGKVYNSENHFKNVCKHGVPHGFKCESCEKIISIPEDAVLKDDIVKTEIEGQVSPIFTLKLHTFFSQGRTMMSCITQDGPHINDKGEVSCSICAQRGLESLNFPLHFCRSCGQEYYGIAIQMKGLLCQAGYTFLF